MNRRAVAPAYENSSADKLGMLAMGLFIGLLIAPASLEGAAVATLLTWSVWPLVDGYHHEVVRT